MSRQGPGENSGGFAESVAGTIERVTYFNEETGFAVLRVQVKGRRELVTVVGSVPSANAGEWVTAEGAWTRDREHGMQFKASSLRSVPPTSREGIEKYLGSGLIKGIGPVYAKKLVAKFGEKVLDIIERESARMEDVEGIGPMRRRQIKDAWNAQRVIREIMVFLHSHGVGTSRAVRIHRTYGDEAIAKVRENPYRLAQDIGGIGFLSADRVAARLGIGRDSLQRAAAGVRHVLLEAAGDGHCALPEQLLVGAAAKLLELEPQRVGEGLGRSLEAGELVREVVGGESLIYLPYLRSAEARVAERLRALASRPAAYQVADIGKAIDWAEARSGMQLAPSQREALRVVLANRGCVVTGGPGVGKTTLVKTLLTILRAKNVRCLLCAPTGRAAKRMADATGLDASTIHRLLEFKGTGKPARNAARPLDCECLVVDESSMIDVPLMQRLMDALPCESGLVLVGDVDQLPSVGPGLVLSQIIASAVVPVVRLTEIFRQAGGSRIIVNAHRVNAGHMPEFPAGGAEAGSDFYFIERDGPEQIAETLLEVVCRRIPAKFGLDPAGDVQVLTPMNRGSLGVLELNRVLQERLNPPRADRAEIERFGWVFRVGDKVIQTRNNYDKDVFNGDIGRVRAVDPSDQEVRVAFDGREVAYDPGELDELAPAFAITIHKAQGSEFPAVVIPVSTQHFLLLQRNLLYTGITRGSRLVILVGQKKALGMAVRNHDESKRVSGLLERLRG